MAPANELAYTPAPATTATGTQGADGCSAAGAKKVPREPNVVSLDGHVFRDPDGGRDYLFYSYLYDPRLPGAGLVVDSSVLSL